MSELNRVLVEHGYSPISTNYISFGFGGLIELPKVGVHVLFEGVTHRTSEGPGDDVNLRQYAVDIGGYYKLFDAKGITFGPSFGTFGGALWLEGCPRSFERCASSREVFGVDLGLRTAARVRWRGVNSGPFFTSLIAYRAQLAETDWGKGGKRAGAEPNTKSSGALVRIGVGFWY